MKSSITIVLLATLLLACQHRQTDNKQNEKTQNKIVVFHIDDYSQSTDNNVCYFDSTTARNLYMFLASQDKAVIKHAGIFSASLDQQIFTLNVQMLDTAITDSKNVYIAAKNKSKKQKALSAFLPNAEQDIAKYVAQIYRKHNAEYSDINGACQLMATTLAQPNWADYSKYVIFSSDMRNDEQGKRNSVITPVLLQNTTILFIRPALNKDSLKSIFPESDIEVFTDANDIISFLKSKHQ